VPTCNSFSIFTSLNLNKGILFFSWLYLKFGTVKELFELYILKRKFFMFPIIILLIAMIGITALTQSGLTAFIYPI